MKGDLRCIEGRLWRHDPQFDDPYLETDVGECADCGDGGCNADPHQELFEEMLADEMGE